MSMRWKNQTLFFAGYPASTICRRRDPQHEQHEELLDWLGDGREPEALSADEVNRRPLEEIYKLWLAGPLRAGLS